VFSLALSSLAVFSLASVFVSSVSAVPESEGLSIASIHTPTLCLAANASADGSRLELLDCTPYSRYNEFVFSPDGHIQLVEFSSTTGLGACVDVTAGVDEPGTLIQIWKCETGNTNQNWTVVGNTIRWQHDMTTCLTIANDKFVLHNGIQLWPCGDGSDFPTQQFSFNKPGKLGSGGSSSSTTTTSTSSSTSTTTQTTTTSTQTPVHPLEFSPKSAETYCLAAPSTTNGSPLTLEQCSTASQYDEFIYTSTGQLELVDTSTQAPKGVCLDVTNGDDADGTIVQLWSCVTGNTNQVWETDGSTIRWKTDTSKCLDVTNGVFEDGTKIQIWSCGDGTYTNQQFSVESIS